MRNVVMNGLAVGTVVVKGVEHGTAAQMQARLRAASCPPGPHLETKVDAFAQLRILDFSDAPVLPADAARCHQAIEDTVGQVLAAGAIPIALRGDHSIAEPDIRACAALHSALGIVHFDTHTDTGTEVFGVEVSHGRPMYRLVEAGHMAPKRYVQIGLRGYWPASASSPGRRARVRLAGGARDHELFMHDVRDRGIRAVVDEALEPPGGAQTPTRP